MNSILFRIALSGLLSVASLLVVLFRVSPLTAPQIALPVFFLTLFLSLATAASLLLYGVWGCVPIEGLDAGRKLTVSLREGVFLASACLLIVLFHILSILNWWIATLIVMVFGLVEMALHV